MTETKTSSVGVTDHPKGLAYLGFTEAGERLSFYGMSALLVLYMAQVILQPSRIERAVGLISLRHGIEALTGPLSLQQFGSQIFGLYSGLVYFTPLVGGLIADRWLGARRTVMLGAVLLCCGHFAMAFDQSFLVALILLIVGSGCLKGNISAQLGQLYPLDAEAQRARGYLLFAMAINIGSIAGPLVCGSLAQYYGWHAGFGFAGAIMLAALGIYLAGLRHFPIDPKRSSRKRLAATPFTREERRRIGLLLVVLLIAIFPCSTQGQVFNVGQVWTAAHVDLTTRFGTIPIPWFNAVDAGFGVVGTPLVIALWRRQQKRRGEPNPLTKIAVGAFLVSLSSLPLAFGTWLGEGSGTISPLWPAVGYGLRGFAFIWYWPTVLSLVSQAAPARINATLLSASFLAFFVGNLVVGAVGTLYERFGPVGFWLFDALIPLGGVLIIVMFGRSIAGGLAMPLSAAEARN